MNLGKTSALGVLSSLFSGAVLFIVFRIAVELVGTTLLGSWVLVQSAFFLARIPEAGIGINLTRRVRIETNDGRASLWPFVAAGFLICVMPILVIGLIMLEPTTLLLQNYFHTGVSTATLRLLAVLSLATAFFGSTASVALSVLEGIGGLGRRYHATNLSNLVLVASIYPLVSAFGVVGIGLAYAAQSLAMCGAGLFLLRGATTPDRDIAPHSPYAIARRLWRENVLASTMAVTRMSFEPWTKFLVASTGGLAAVAYLDLALKVTGQIRVAVQSATQPLLWFGSRSDDKDPSGVHAGFDRAHHLVTKSNLFLIGLQTIAAGFISYLGLGVISAEFVVFYLTLAVGNAVNSMGVVGYYYDASAGRLRRLLDIHVKMMVMNLALGGIGAVLIGAPGAVAAYALSFAYGGYALSASWMSESGRRWSDDLRAEIGSLVQAAAATALAVLLFRGMTFGISDLVMAGISALLATILLAAFLQRNWRSYVR